MGETDDFEICLECCCLYIRSELCQNIHCAIVWILSNNVYLCVRWYCKTIFSFRFSALGYEKIKWSREAIVVVILLADICQQ